MKSRGPVFELAGVALMYLLLKTPTYELISPNACRDSYQEMHSF
jgi:hypothetical protein